MDHLDMDEHTKKWISRAIRDHLNSTEDNVPLLCLCGICGDRATGKHYGALSCDGCKGFFRRSVRNNNVYTCRFNRRCEISKDRRNQCRYCRLRNCFKVGMKISAVQNERDKISKHRGPHQEELEPNQGLAVNALRHAESKCREFPGNTDSTSRVDNHSLKTTIQDLYENVRRQLPSVAAWAKTMPIFENMCATDQLTLVRGFAVHNLVMGAVRRSLHLEEIINFGNGCVLSCGWYGKRHKNGTTVDVAKIGKKNGTDVDLAKVGLQICRELIQPLAKVQMDITEFACLKALVFFDPYINHLGDTNKVSRARSQVQMNLEDYINDHQYDFRGRFGDLLLTLPSLKEISQQFTQLFKDAGLYNGAVLDQTASLLLADPTIHIKALEFPQATQPVEPLKVKRKNSRAVPIKAQNGGDTDSSTTLSSPESPNLMDLDSMEHITVKVEPDFDENYYENSS